VKTTIKKKRIKYKIHDLSNPRRREQKKREKKIERKRVYVSI
jgi:hypothetical protein